ncbi:catalase family peroxidase [Hansschlegelia plantiphila]|uniref:Catalase-related peroxidase n=1 Tax=Hansschlegelia plantiphila TaxID=374655 RepID=A0A9W6MWR8_9HYPH|nr:catalase family peroxidase [Hansschlegelia plantiphila]GLK69117.1 sulfur regulated plasmid-encoded protein [Hansschlegelia plantiphila]
MAEPARSILAPFLAIGLVVAGGAGAFAYTAGWLSPDRLTPDRMVDAFAPPGGPAPGHRRNHAKGVCFTGVFEANGAGAALSRARVFATGGYPVVGRFNFGTPDPNAPDATARARGLSIKVSTPDGQEWRSAMISAPVFPVSTPQAFYELLKTPKDPNAMKAFAAAHPEIGAFGAWAKSAPWTASYAEERYNSLNSFIFTDSGGEDRAVRWSFIPEATPVPVPAEDLPKRGRDFLEKEIAERIAAGPARWTLAVTVAEPGDPTADPSKAWPAGRKTVEVGKLVAQKIEPEADGPCRDVNFDPTVLPSGIRTSDDQFPAARSAAYAVSFDRRSAEAKDYPAK